jgi:2,3-dihydro-2,3-dihydroxybenzoate dehydrogenase
MTAEFRDQVAVVSGAAQGIGKAVADALVEAGARVAALDIQFSEQPGSESGSKQALTCWNVDVSSSLQVNHTIDQIEQQLGPVRYLVCAAGVLTPARLDQTSDETWLNTFAVNVTGAFYLARRVAKSMRLHKQGSMVAVGSNAAATPRMNMGSYAASKAALSQLFKCLGLELAGDGIRCNLVAPGSTDTDMQRRLWRDGNDEQQTIEGNLANYRTGIPLRRIATPAQIANSVLFLLSEQASHITMENLVVDGGATLGAK